jgi:hypothetical protein
VESCELEQQMPQLSVDDTASVEQSEDVATHSQLVKAAPHKAVLVDRIR